MGFRPGYEPVPANAPPHRSYTPAPAWSSQYSQAPPMPALPPQYGQQPGYSGAQYYPQATAAPTSPTRPAQSPNRHIRDGNFLNWTPADMAAPETQAQRDNTCPTCLNPAPTSWRFGKVSQRMVCQPCSLYERRNGIQRTPEVEAQKMLRTLAGGRR
ncbi:hypothetical protein HMN09_00855300 [Mycena chlorophos]|uniref:GATA-type domain-containing protein n=1 Tax=Mycena chlorophos TaxID=658473 RepID=A0A8H6SUC3_MYCCL|nr:hypothetical protein HMN09_00855300 [Mycena chlorophos]